MGGTQSKAVVKQLSEVLTNVCVETIQSCEVVADQSQTITVVNTGFKFWGNYTLKQETEIRSDCFSNTQKETELQNKLIEKISQASTAEGTALLDAFGGSKSVAKTELGNIVKTNITMSNIQKSYSSIKQGQSAEFMNSGIIVFETAELVQGSKLFAAATLKEITNAGIFNTIETYLDQQASAKSNNPFDVLAKIFGSIALAILFVIVFIIIIIVIGVVAFKYFFSGG